MELYAQAFEQVGALDKLEGFASFFGADFYGLPRSGKTLTLVKKTWIVPEHYGPEDYCITPLKAGEELHWQVLA
jgi:dihydroorotase